MNTGEGQAGPRVVCEEIDVVVTVRTLNGSGQTIAIQQTQPLKLLRANVPDIWAFLDAQLQKRQ